jgi:hypothetical protein
MVLDNTSIAIPISRVSQEGAHCILGLNFDPKTTLLWINHIILTHYLPQYPLLKIQSQKKSYILPLIGAFFIHCIPNGCCPCPQIKNHISLIGIFWFIAFLMVIPHHREAIGNIMNQKGSWGI